MVDLLNNQYYYKGPVNVSSNINKSIFEKILSIIEKTVKTFSIPDKTFSKNDILLCVLREQISKFFIIMVYSTYVYFYSSL